MPSPTWPTCLHLHEAYVFYISDFFDEIFADVFTDIFAEVCADVFADAFVDFFGDIFADLFADLFASLRRSIRLPPPYISECISPIRTRTYKGGDGRRPPHLFWWG